MINIIKGTEPQSLTNRRNTVQNWDNAYDGSSRKVKKSISKSVCREQGYICAYCMSRITSRNTANEHWVPQTNPDKSKQLDYGNIIGSCKGNQNEHVEDPDNEIRCDHCKSHSIIKYNPADPNIDIEALIFYDSDGKIRSTDPDFDNQLNRVLNLNYTKLKRSRNDTWYGLLRHYNNDLMALHTNKQHLITLWRSRNELGQLEEYCGFVLYLLSSL